MNTMSQLSKKFASFIGANTIHKSDGSFVKIEHTDASRIICYDYLKKGTTAWAEFLKKEFGKS